ncbi:MAG: thioredoxin domain-containing protein [Deltaproteobacteria bacterium]|nr:thioredoxin domain-containing protein [Deltaproteobacteria bacterium]
MPPTNVRASITFAPLLVATFVLETACSSSSSLVMVPVGDSPVRGEPDAWVTIIEFSDFQCPYCAASQPIIDDVLDEHPTDLRLVFKHFPLTSIHENALSAAIAAECARAQARFWTYHDLLFAHRASLSAAHQTELAEEAGLNVAQWASCLATSAPRDRVESDRALGLSVGVKATPTFIINGQPFVGVPDRDEFEQLCLTARDAAIGSGIARAKYYDEVILGL